MSPRKRKPKNSEQAGKKSNQAPEKAAEPAPMVGEQKAACSQAGADKDKEELMFQK